MCNEKWTLKSGIDDDDDTADDADDDAEDFGNGNKTREREKKTNGKQNKMIAESFTCLSAFVNASPVQRKVPRRHNTC